jgi:RHS repeat-associated protein
MRDKIAALVIAVCICLSTSAFAAHGRTNGAPSVSADGSAEYSISLWSPPGIAGLNPSLGLSYSSATSNGLLGVGWSVRAGQSVIERCPKTYSQDGTPAPVSLVTTDGYCLDGVRLRLASGIYGQAGSTYRTELESYARVAAYGAAGNGPAYFVVERPDGLIAEYGNTADSRIEAQGGSAASVRTWAINKLRDRAQGSVGNSIQYVYSEDTTNRTFRISEITFPHTATGGGPFYKIQFVYQSRAAADTQSSYVSGGQAFNTQLLDRIDVSYSNSGWQLVRKYDLSYEIAPETSESRLTTMVECSASECFAPSTFSYQDGTTGWLAEVSTGFTIPAGDSLLIDVNGDGRDDFVYPNSTYRIAFANGTGFNTPIDTGISSSNSTQALPIDFNSDGQMDILIPNASSQWRVLQSTGTSFSAIDLGITATGAGNNAWVADYDGDGRQDLLYVTSPNLVGSRVRGRKNTGSSFSTEEILYSPDPYEQIGCGSTGGFLPINGRQKANVRVPDFDGDGRADVLVCIRFDRNEGIPPTNYQNRWRALLSRTSSYVAAANLTLTVTDISAADFNGDGFTDVVYPGTTKWAVALGNGVGGFGTVPTNTNLGTVSAARFLDFDGDGRADLLTATTGPNNFLTRYSGTGFDAAINITSTMPGSVGVSKVGDVNGDGLLDFVYVDGSGILKYRLHSGVRADLLTNASDGFGVTVTFAYQPLTSPAVYTRYTNAIFPQQDIQFAKPVVSQLTTSNGSGWAGTVAKTFQYEGGRVDLRGRGWLGFAKRTSVDGAGGYNFKAVTNYRQDFPFVGLPLNSELQQSNGARIAHSSFVWANHAWGSGDTSRQFPYLQSSQAKQYEVGGTIDGALLTTTDTTSVVDVATGFPYSVTSTTTEAATSGGLYAGSTFTQQTLTPIGNILNDTTNWCLGKPGRVEQRNSHSLSFGSLITRTRELTWDAVKCRVTQAVDEPGDSSLQVVTGVTYDSFGNVNGTTVSGINVPSRTASNSYGTNGLFLESTTDALLQTSNLAWDYKFGVPSSVSDPNSLQTVWQYDSFGRRTQQNNSDNTSSIWTYENCVDVNYCPDTIKTLVRQSDRDTSSVVFRDVWTYLDKFERPVEIYRKSLHDPSSQYAVRKMRYDNLGRVYQASPSVLTSAWSENYFSTFSFDSVGRLLQLSRPISADNLSPATTLIAYEGLKTTTTDAEQRLSIKISDAVGQLVRSLDHDGYFQTFSYDPFGNAVRVQDSSANVLQSATFNVRGMLIGRTDMDMGGWIFGRDALGQLTSQTNARGQTINFGYDKLGRLKDRTEVAEATTTTWVWGISAASKEINRLHSVSGPGYAESYQYDAKGRLSIATVTADATNYQLDYAYNGIGALEFLTYPTSTNSCRLKIKYLYTRGALSSVENASNATDCGSSGETYWSATAEDGRGQIVSESFGNSVLNNRAYDPVTGWLKEIKSGSNAGADNFQYLKYTWDKVGNLKTRKDENQAGLSEAFYYDNLHRLDYSQLNGVTNLDLSYDALGNITSNTYKPNGVTAIGTYTYDPARKHQVTSTSNGWSFAYDADGNMQSGRGSTIVWNSYGYPNSISDGTSSASFLYAPNRQYWKQVAVSPAGNTTTTYVAGVLEKVLVNGITDYRHQIQVGSARIIISRPNSGPNNVYYITRDHLGSSSVISNTNGLGASLLANTSFNAFGARRGSNWTGVPSSGDEDVFRNTGRRGFTDHTMLDPVNLVHMNGRVYDPWIGRFLSADPLISEPDNTQNFNRYSYVYNRPLTLVDPSGFEASGSEPRSRYCQDGNCTAFRYGQSWSTAYNVSRLFSVSSTIHALRTRPTGTVGTTPATESGAGAYGAFGLNGNGAPEGAVELQNFLCSIGFKFCDHDVFEGSPSINDDRLRELEAKELARYREWLDHYARTVGPCLSKSRACDEQNEIWMEWCRQDSSCGRAEPTYPELLFVGGGAFRAFGAETATARQSLVIGKLADLKNLRTGERTLLGRLPNLGSPKANWNQNASVLRQEMSRGAPIRDASVDSAGQLINNTGFLRAERELLNYRGWTYNPSTNFWHPPVGP